MRLSEPTVNVHRVTFAVVRFLVLSSQTEAERGGHNSPRHSGTSVAMCCAAAAAGGAAGGAAAGGVGGVDVAAAGGVGGA